MSSVLSNTFLIDLAIAKLTPTVSLIFLVFPIRRIDAQIVKYPRSESWHPFFTLDSPLDTFKHLSIV